MVGLIGLERLLGQSERARHWGNIGLLSNPSGVTADLTAAGVALLRAKIPITRLYGPEHGVDGSGAANEAPELLRDAATGLPTTVLYHLTEAQTAERLFGLDTLLIDLQDVGVRFYTYISTIRDVLRAAKHLQSRGTPLRVVVLDRPNPLGFGVEGPLLEPQFRSFVGVTSVLPLRHGLTIAEVARVLAEEEGTEVEVVLSDQPNGWPADRPWVPPSPNLPDLQSVRLYAGTALVEALDASEGRGTALPFRLVGAPNLDAIALAAQLNTLNLGVTARPAYFNPTSSKHAGKRCAGVHLHEYLHETQGELRLALPLGLALFTALEQAGAKRNADWLQKLLGVPAEQVPSHPAEALAALKVWQQAGLAQSQRLSKHWLYPR